MVNEHSQETEATNKKQSKMKLFIALIIPLFSTTNASPCSILNPPKNIKIQKNSNSQRTLDLAKIFDIDQRNINSSFQISPTQAGKIKDSSFVISRAPRPKNSSPNDYILHETIKDSLIIVRNSKFLEIYKIQKNGKIGKGNLLKIDITEEIFCYDLVHHLSSNSVVIGCSDLSFNTQYFLVYSFIQNQIYISKFKEDQGQGPVILSTVISDFGSGILIFEQYNQNTPIYFYELDQKSFELSPAKIDDKFLDTFDRPILDLYHYTGLDSDGKEVRRVIVYFNNIEYEMRNFDLVKNDKDEYSLVLKGEIEKQGFKKGFIMVSRGEGRFVVKMSYDDQNVTICKGYGGGGTTGSHNFYKSCEVVENWPVSKTVDIRPSKVYVSPKFNAFVRYRVDRPGTIAVVRVAAPQAPKPYPDFWITERFNLISTFNYTFSGSYVYLINNDEIQQVQFRNGSFELDQNYDKFLDKEGVDVTIKCFNKNLGVGGEEGETVEFNVKVVQGVGEFDLGGEEIEQELRVGQSKRDIFQSWIKGNLVDYSVKYSTSTVNVTGSKATEVKVEFVPEEKFNSIFFVENNVVIYSLEAKTVKVFNYTRPEAQTLKTVFYYSHKLKNDLMSTDIITSTGDQIFIQSQDGRHTASFNSTNLFSDQTLPKEREVSSFRHIVHSFQNDSGNPLNDSYIATIYLDSINSIPRFTVSMKGYKDFDPTDYKFFDKYNFGFNDWCLIDLDAKIGNSLDEVIFFRLCTEAESGSGLGQILKVKVNTLKGYQYLNSQEIGIDDIDESFKMCSMKGGEVFFSSVKKNEIFSFDLEKFSEFEKINFDDFNITGLKMVNFDCFRQEGLLVIHFEQGIGIINSDTKDPDYRYPAFIKHTKEIEYNLADFSRKSNFIFLKNSKDLTKIKLVNLGPPKMFISSSNSSKISIEAQFENPNKKQNLKFNLNISSLKIPKNLTKSFVTFSPISSLNTTLNPKISLHKHLKIQFPVNKISSPSAKINYTEPIKTTPIDEKFQKRIDLNKIKIDFFQVVGNNLVTLGKSISNATVMIAYDLTTEDYHKDYTTIATNETDEAIYHHQRNLEMNFYDFYYVDGTKMPGYAFKIFYPNFDSNPLEISFCKDFPLSLTLYTDEICSECTKFSVKSYPETKSVIYASGLDQRKNFFAVYKTDGLRISSQVSLIGSLEGVVDVAFADFKGSRSVSLVLRAGFEGKIFYVFSGPHEEEFSVKEIGVGNSLSGFEKIECVKKMEKIENDDFEYLSCMLISGAKMYEILLKLDSGELKVDFYKEYFLNENFNEKTQKAKIGQKFIILTERLESKVYASDIFQKGEQGSSYKFYSVTTPGPLEFSKFELPDSNGTLLRLFTTQKESPINLTQISIIEDFVKIQGKLEDLSSQEKVLKVDSPLVEDDIDLPIEILSTKETVTLKELLFLMGIALGVVFLILGIGMIFVCKRKKTWNNLNSEEEVFLSQKITKASSEDSLIKDLKKDFKPFPSILENVKNEKFQDSA